MWVYTKVFAYAFRFLSVHTETYAHLCHAAGAPRQRVPQQHRQWRAVLQRGGEARLPELGQLARAGADADERRAQLAGSQQRREMASFRRGAVPLHKRGRAGGVAANNAPVRIHHVIARRVSKEAQASGK